MRENWTDPGAVQRGDYLVIRARHCELSAVALRDEDAGGNVAYRNENGIRGTAHASRIVDRWEGGALAAGPLANGSGPA